LSGGRAGDAEAVLSSIEAQVRASTNSELPPVVEVVRAARPPAPRARARDLLRRPYAYTTLMLWIAWCAEYGVLYSFQTFVPTILASEGRSVVKSFEFSLVIYSAVIPAYALGGPLADWLDRKYCLLAAF